MNTYKWTILSLSTLPSPPAPIENCAIMAQYVVRAINEENSTLTASISGLAQFSIPENNENLTPFKNLTEEQVIEWIQSDADLVENIKANLDGQIEGQINPPILPTEVPLPWENNKL
jgi:hypothetical protein